MNNREFIKGLFIGAYVMFFGLAVYGTLVKIEEAQKNQVRLNLRHVVRDYR